MHHRYLSHREDQARRDNLPCPSCGGDRLRPDFTARGACHAGLGARYTDITESPTRKDHRNA